MIRLGSGSGRWTLVRTGSRLGLQASLQKQQSFTRLRLAVADDTGSWHSLSAIVCRQLDRLQLRAMASAACS
jgi:hypothetical protein